MVILENIDIDIDIDKAILQNIDIDKISNRFKFGISNRARYAPTAVIHDAWYCMVFHGIPWYCMILHGPALYCIVWHGIAQYCTVLHGIAW